MNLLSSRSRVIALVFMLTCAALLVSGVSLRRGGPFTGSTQPLQPRVTNRTSSINVSNVQRLNTGDFEVRLSNKSNKTIYAYTIVTGQRGVRRGFTTFATAEPVAPGETRSEIVSAGNLDTQGARPEGEIIFSAVYLEGGAVEGDPPDSQKLGQTMRGMKEQSKLVLAVLRNAVASDGPNPKELLKQIESAVSSKPVNNNLGQTSREHGQ